MGLRVEREVGNRFDDRVTTAPLGLVSATDKMLTVWATGPELAEVRTVRAEEALPGPLAWLTGPSVLAWGPSVLDERLSSPVGPLVAAALADLGEGAPRSFALSAGAVAGDGALAALVLVRRQPRVVASRVSSVPTVASRVVVVHRRDAFLVAIVVEDGAPPTTIAWGDGPLAIGRRGGVTIADGNGDPTEVDVGDITAARSLAAVPGHGLVAGMASGKVVRVEGPPWRPTAAWGAHDGPVTAVAWHAEDERLATGGTDGLVRVWSGGRSMDARLGAPVEALSWVDPNRLAAKAGGPGGRLFLLHRAG